MSKRRRGLSLRVAGEARPAHLARRRFKNCCRSSGRFRRRHERPLLPRALVALPPASVAQWKSSGLRPRAQRFDSSRGPLTPWPSRTGARLQSATRRFESARCLAERRTEMTTFEIVEQGTILRATVGSTVHGLHHGGQDDRDEMAVFVEPPEYLLGLARARGIRGGLYGFEHFVERTQPEGVRSGPGDLDLVAYSLRKYIRLALKGHPTILLLLFVPDELVHVKTNLGDELRALRPALLSGRAGRGDLGYLGGQKERLFGTRGQKRVNRPELVDAHGFDSKYAMHAARLGYQGLELLETGWLTLPMPEPERSRVMAIRKGERTFDETIEEIEEVEQRLAEALERTPLPPEPDRVEVDRFLVDAYRRAWCW